MVIMSLVSWWYGAGLRTRLANAMESMAKLIDTFSFIILLKTFFAPFRQLSVGQVQGPLAVKMKAFFDRLISRFIGAMLRFSLIIAGIVSMIVVGVVQIVISILWLILPFSIVVGLVLMMIEWMPWIA